MKFVNRKEEIQFLQERYFCKDPQLVILYGRRRVGKTELALRFSKDKPHIYFLASETSERDNLEGLFSKIYDFYKDDILSYERNWENLFKYLSRKKERLILIIDEFPYLVSQNKSLPSIFQKGWDLYLKKSNIFLVLSGSSVSMMESYTLNYKSPLYGRRTGQWKLNPLKFRDLAGFFPNYKISERAAVYGAIGSIPAYLVKFVPKVSFWKNIEDNLLSKGTFLYEEIDFLLKQELREPKVYKNILKSIALGNTKFSEIMNAAGIDKSKLFIYLENLESLHFIEKRIPVLDSMRSKKSRYYIRDNFFRFYFRYILPNKSFLEEGQKKIILNKIRKDYDNYLGRYVWEDICRQFLWENLSHLPFIPEKIGKQWGVFRFSNRAQSYEIDLLALNSSEKKVMLIECKWKDNVETGKVLAGLKDKLRFLPHFGKNWISYYCVIAKSFKNKERFPDNVLLFDLKDWQD